MRKIKYFIIALSCLGFTSCGIFKKNCNCPHFGKLKIRLQTFAVSSLA